MDLEFSKSRRQDDGARAEVVAKEKEAGKKFSMVWDKSFVPTLHVSSFCRLVPIVFSSRHDLCWSPQTKCFEAGISQLLSHEPDEVLLSLSGFGFDGVEQVNYAGGEMMYTNPAYSFVGDEGVITFETRPKL